MIFYPIILGFVSKSVAITIFIQTILVDFFLFVNLVNSNSNFECLKQV